VIDSVSVDLPRVTLQPEGCNLVHAVQRTRAVRSRARYLARWSDHRGWPGPWAHGAAMVTEASRDRPDCVGLHDVASRAPAATVMASDDDFVADASPRLGRVQPVESVTRQIAVVTGSGLQGVKAVRQGNGARAEAELLDAFAATVDDSARADVVETVEGLETQREKSASYGGAGALSPQLTSGHFVLPAEPVIETAVEAVARWFGRRPRTDGSAPVSPTSCGRAGPGCASGSGSTTSRAPTSSTHQATRTSARVVRAKCTDASVLMPRDMLHMRTVGAAEVTGADDRRGSIDVGTLADFRIVDHRARDRSGTLTRPTACGTSGRYASGESR
jgi:hypothetical protein